MIWKTIKAEWQQRHENLMLHFAEGALPVVVVALFAGTGHCAWRWTFCGVVAAGVLWEIGGALVKDDKAWAASILGAVAVILGATLAAVGVLIAGGVGA